MRGLTRVRPVWTHVRHGTLPTQQGSVCQVELVECFRSSGYRSHFSPPLNADNAPEYGVRALVTDLDGRAMFVVEGWLSRDSSRQIIEDRVLAETERRLAKADWSRDMVYVVSGF